MLTFKYSKKFLERKNNSKNLMKKSFYKKIFPIKICTAVDNLGIWDYNK